ncbi:hypothetical protein KR51_00020500 [Rubidibacter lacunae KORDI 51-2]|uniref:Uncharacterized protein n=1 Tax=Rubidibacter lacunae KORDI 51-2 TaxID=582515 RepID=U5DA66_9CHRO|nr:hypothetical protein [Rubidibacter lacunae]ERN41473.1 hypothetical protein KR51_00020500 [Rubidibacter lacunae KORDI 51-2]
MQTFKVLPAFILWAVMASETFARATPAASEAVSPDCLVDDPDGSVREDRALTRAEFAAGLDACLQWLEERVGQPSNAGVTRADLEDVQR